MNIQEKAKLHSWRVGELFGVKPQKGEIGIEIETIGKSLPEGFIKTRLWGLHNDDSVKVRAGETAREYVLAQPVGRQKVQLALEELHEEFKLCKSVIAEDRLSNSVHIHINAQSLSLQQVYTWLAVYFIFEEILVRWAGEDRVGNLFCLRAKDAEGLIKMLAKSAREDNYGNFSQDSYRYAAANVLALSKFGSLEFRALRGTVQIDVINSWIETLLCIKDRALEYQNPVAVLADFSQRSCIGFARHVLPAPMRNFALTQPDFMDIMFDGARLAQDFAFSCKWQNKVYERSEEDKKTSPRKKVSFDEMALQQMAASVDTTWGNTAFAPGNVSIAAEWPAPTQTPPSVTTIQSSWVGVIRPNASTVLSRSAPGDQPSSFRSYRIRPTVRQQLEQQGRTVQWMQSSGQSFLAIVRPETQHIIRWMNITTDMVQINEEDDD